MRDLILLHGALGDQKQLEKLASELRSQFTINLLEFKGHGQTSGSVHSLGIPEMAEELDRYIKEYQLKDVQVFGYSMGGYVALYHNLIYPGRIQKIACLATKFAWDPETAVKETSVLSPAVVIEKFPGFAALLEKRHGTYWKHVLENTASMMIALGNNPLLNEISLSQLDAKCLLLLGDKDHMVSLEETLATAGIIPNAQFKLLENTIHPIEKVDTKKIADLLSGFFS
ncbi:MAG: alpha/beta fold hydrolase [Saprospiraceae bacterium]|nr:alpha/beta fold hydrolase [Saprospiraceae bacterium]